MSQTYSNDEKAPPSSARSLLSLFCRGPRDHAGRRTRFAKSEPRRGSTLTHLIAFEAWARRWGRPKP